MSTWRGDFKKIQTAHASLIALSTDQTYAQRVFKESLGGLPYELGSDWMRTVAQAYGVYDAKGGFAQRSVFVLDREHRLIFQNTTFQAGNREHYDEVLNALVG